MSETYDSFPNWGHSWHPITWKFLMSRIAPYKDLPDWNDVKGRTEAEVIALYRATIEHVENSLGQEKITEPQELVNA